jgi:hypothetical protein
LGEVDRTKETTFYDSVTGKPLFVAPRGRTFEEFEIESKKHGWPSFRDDEVRTLCKYCFLCSDILGIVTITGGNYFGDN